jgi:hypothetical protein
MRMNNSSQNKKNTKTTGTRISFVLLASVLVLSSVSVAQLVTNSNAYAQSSSLTVTGSCGLESGRIDASFIITGGDGNLDTRYYRQVLDSSGTDLSTFGTFALGPSSHFGIFTEPGEQITYNLYQDVDNDFNEGGVEQDELVASDTVTCPSYTDLFKNEGQCLKYARAYPGGDITKRGCQEAF